MKNLTTIYHLKEQFLIKNFVEKTITQLNKDVLGLSDIEVEVADVGAENVLEVLTLNVVELLRELDQTSGLQQFVYKIDLQEINWKYFMSFQNFEKLAEEIIIREAQKVFLRELFK